MFSMFRSALSSLIAIKVAIIRVGRIRADGWIKFGLGRGEVQRDLDSKFDSKPLLPIDFISRFVLLIFFKILMLN
jgi:hypothetical protein